MRITPVKGKAILISGHDIQDTFDLLAQTEGTGASGRGSPAGQGQGSLGRERRSQWDGRPASDTCARIPTSGWVN